MNPPATYDLTSQIRTAIEHDRLPVVRAGSRQAMELCQSGADRANGSRKILQGCFKALVRVRALAVKALSGIPIKEG